VGKPIANESGEPPEVRTSAAWDDLADWWGTEAQDPAYRQDVQPILDALTAGLAGPTLDIGCGDGRLLSGLPQPAIGCDGSIRLLRARAGGGHGVVCCLLPNLKWARSDRFRLAVANMVLEHIDDASGFFAEARRVVAPGGSLVVVSNHPAFTSSGAGPVADSGDGEILWRWGTYLYDSVAGEPAGDGVVVFHHRPLGAILTIAAEQGWALERMMEAGASAATISRLPSLAGQEHMPRLVGMRWRKPAQDAAEKASSGVLP